DSTLASAIIGAGGFVKQGTGTLTLTGASTNVTAAINAGKLMVNGSLGGTMQVNSGGTLGGTGTVGATTIASGGTIAPGNGIGTLNVGGNYIQNAGSTYAVEVNSAGQSDKIAVTGAATINGGTVAVQAAN